ncbi:Lar family restriction alleviation protein [Carnimonas bestiolae]|uniref:Lar family restriction alleviation protein n=1 Tax=Carnimonas bestiolae TaxID=3402172 RepID=UPI003F4A8BDD
MDKLLPCPFCNGKARIVELTSPDSGSYIECQSCHCCTRIHYDRKENLVDSWNHRA